MSTMHWINQNQRGLYKYIEFIQKSVVDLERSILSICFYVVYTLDWYNDL